MNVLPYILLILALVCFVLDAIGYPSAPRVKLTPLGLAFWVLNALVVLVPR
jgi:hypothetical protein